MQPESLAHYRILRPLGSGGMGEVFLAEDTRLHRKVALKLLRQDHPDGAAGRKRLLREAQAAAQLDHPNACSIYEVGEGELGAYIAMQFIEGESLSELMVRQRLELGPLLDIGIQVADALAEAHAQGLVHRDIKPQNIMVTPKGQAKVLDFGLAKRIEAIPVGDTHTVLTNPGMVLGTVPYMSPEQVKGEELDGRSDVFSLGAVLFEVATGRRPFQANSGIELMAMILTYDPFDVADPALPLNPELRRILQDALAKELSKRYQGAREFREDLLRLRALVSGATVPGTAYSGDATTLNRPRPAGLLSTGARARQRRRWAMGLGAALLAGAALGAILWIRPRMAMDSIAVLPVVNANGNVEAAYLCDGLSQGLVNELARHPKLKVIGLASAAHAALQDQDPRRIGKELGVEAVLQNRLSLRGNQLELDAELVDARSMRHLWGQHYTGRTVDLWTLQETLLKDLSQARLPDLARYRPPRNRKEIGGDAYELYLKGNAALTRLTPKDIHEAFAYYDEVLRRAPKFAEANAGKAQGYYCLSGYYMPHVEALTQVKKCSMDALRLDPSLPEAQTLLAYSLAVLDHDYPGADLRYQKAVQQSPNSVKVHQDYGTFLASLGRSAEAKKQFDLALQLDPASAELHCWAAMSSILGNDPAQALHHGQFAHKIAPDLWFPKTLNAWAKGLKGRWAEAWDELEMIQEDRNTTVLLVRGLAAAHTGRKAEAKAMALRLHQPGTPGMPPSFFNSACVYLAMGDADRALGLLEQSVAAKEENVLILKTMPELEPIRATPRFKRLLAIVGQ